MLQFNNNSSIQTSVKNFQMIMATDTRKAFDNHLQLIDFRIPFLHSSRRRSRVAIRSTY